MSLKHLPPTLKKKQRYIIFKIESKKSFGIGEVVNTLWEELLGFLGEKGVGEADPWIMKSLFDEEKQIGGIKTDVSHVSRIRCCLALVDSISGERASLRVVGVSGTIRAAREKLID